MTKQTDYFLLFWSILAICWLLRRPRSSLLKGQRLHRLQNPLMTKLSHFPMTHYNKAIYKVSLRNVSVFSRWNEYCSVYSLPRHRHMWNRVMKGIELWSWICTYNVGSLVCQWRWILAFLNLAANLPFSWYCLLFQVPIQFFVELLIKQRKCPFRPSTWRDRLDCLQSNKRHGRAWSHLNRIWVSK